MITNPPAQPSRVNSSLINIHENNTANKGSKLKNTESNISRHFMGLSALSFILCVVEFKLKFYPEGLGMEEYVHSILNALLLSGLVLYIRKTLQIQDLKLKFQNDYKLLQCLLGIYMIILMILILV